jgi:hypothetical protein
MPIPRSLCTSTFQDLDLELVSGAWPADLDGELVISAPEPSPDLPYCLFGFGALVRISLRPGSHGAPANRFALRARVIDTPSKRLFDKAPEVFHAQSFGYTSPLGFPNQANTAPLPWGDRLFATWDVGRPVEVDPETLTFLGEVGHRHDWGDPTFPMGGLLPFYFSSAHPIVDPERNVLFTVKLVMTPRFELELRVICWDPSGTELRSWPIANSVVAGSSHTLSQTRDWLILADSGNFKSDPGEMAGGPRTVLIDESAPVYLIRKDHLLATPPGTTFTPRFSRIAPTTGHFYGVWDDRDGIRVIFEHMDVMDLGFRLQPDDLDAYGNPIDPAKVGLYNMARAPNSLSEVHIDPQTGVATRTALFREDWTYNLQLTAMDWSTEGLTRPTMHHVVYQGWRPDAVSQRALQLYQRAGRVTEVPDAETPGVLATFERDGLRLHDSWTFHDTGDHLTSPIFAPRGAGTDPRRSRYAGTDPGGHDGFVVLPILSDDGFRVEVFDAAHVGRGPLAVLRAPGRVTLPTLLHSAWMPSVGPAPEAERLRFADELDDAQVDALPEHLPDVVRLVAGELADALG